MIPFLTELQYYVDRNCVCAFSSDVNCNNPKSTTAHEIPNNVFQNLARIEQDAFIFWEQHMGSDYIVQKGMSRKLNSFVIGFPQILLTHVLFTIF